MFPIPVASARWPFLSPKRFSILISRGFPVFRCKSSMITKSTSCICGIKPAALWFWPAECLSSPLASPAFARTWETKPRFSVWRANKYLYKTQIYVPCAESKMDYFYCQHTAVSTKRQIALNAKVTQRKLMIQTYFSIFISPDFSFDPFGDVVGKVDDCLRRQEVW